MRRLLFTVEARSDIADAAAWYRDQAPEIVPEFRAAFREIVHRIGTNPSQFPSSPYKTRRALLRRFPYLVIFRERERTIYVVAVFHTSRDPRMWQNRIT